MWCCNTCEARRHSASSRPREFSTTTISAGAQKHSAAKDSPYQASPSFSFSVKYCDPEYAKWSHGGNANTRLQRREKRMTRTSPLKCSPDFAREDRTSTDSAAPRRPSCLSIAAAQWP